MPLRTLLIPLLLLLSTSAVSAAVDYSSDAYKTGSIIGYVLLGGMALLVVVNLLRKRGILGSPKAAQSQKNKWMTPWFLTWATLFLLLAAYVCSYLPRRSDGSYRTTKSGELRSVNGLPLDDIQQWNPMGCWWQHTFQEADGSYKSKGNKWGFIYAPLITIDRRFNYPDKSLNRVAVAPDLSNTTAQR